MKTEARDRVSVSRFRSVDLAVLRVLAVMVAKEVTAAVPGRTLAESEARVGLELWVVQQG